jgi:hypothetical protein
LKSDDLEIDSAEFAGHLLVGPDPLPPLQGHNPEQLTPWHFQIPGLYWPLSLSLLAWVKGGLNATSLQGEMNVVNLAQSGGNRV